MGRPRATIKHRGIKAPKGFIISNIEYKDFKEEIYGITDIKSCEVFFIKKEQKKRMVKKS